MRAYLILGLCLLFVGTFFSSEAQRREDRVDVSLFSQKSPKLSNVKGWVQSYTTGKWVSHIGYIGDTEIHPENKTNFKWLQTGRFKVGDKTYFVWFYERLPEYYMGYTVMPLLEYVKLLKQLEKPGRTAIAVTHGAGDAGQTGEVSITSSIRQALAADPAAFDKPSSPTKGVIDSVYIDYQVIDGKKVIRFEPTCGMYTNFGYFESDYEVFKTVMLPVTPAEMQYADSVFAAKARELAIEKAREDSTNNALYEEYMRSQTKTH